MIIDSLEEINEIKILLNMIHEGEWSIEKLCKGHTNKVATASLKNTASNSDMNSIQKVYNNNLVDDKDGRIRVIFKIFLEGELIDREKERFSIYYLSKHNLAPKIHLIFGNGMITEFIEGKVLEEHEMKANTNSIARKLKEWHSIPIKNLRLNSKDFNVIRIGEGQAEKSYSDKLTLNPEPCLINIIRKWFKMGLKTHSVLLNNLGIEQRIDKIENHLEKENYQIGFCHNDLLASNILKDKNGNVYFIDFEYSGINYKGFDIANHFAEYAGYDLDLKKNLSFDEMKEFLFIYNNKNYAQRQSIVTFSEVIFFIPVTHLFWGLWALLRDGDDFDYYKYGCSRLNIFIKNFTARYFLLS